MRNYRDCPVCKGAGVFAQAGHWHDCKRTPPFPLVRLDSGELIDKREIDRMIGG